jgi:hypothetical protein
MMPFNVVQEKNWWKEKFVKEMKAHVVGFKKYVEFKKMKNNKSWTTSPN